HLKNLKELRRKEPRIQTSLTTLEVLPLLAKQKLGLLSPKKPEKLTIFQVPPSQWGIEVITPNFIEVMHQRGAIIQVWTINEAEEMKRLLTMGVDSIMTDHPLIAIEVAKELGLR
ncbi:MAG: glycerophosphodiester phosphodiesterase family protein, partial [Sphaerochaeta sp.]